MLSSYCEKNSCASVALHKQGIGSDWKSDLSGSEPLTMCRYSNTGIQKGTLLLDIPQFPKIGIKNRYCSEIFLKFLKVKHLYVLPTQLGRL